MHGESSALVAQKAKAAFAAGLMPIICVGETLEQRENGQTNDVLSRQLSESLPADATAQNCLLAYEPVWAIGTGKVASTEQVRETHAHIASKVPAGILILYGGSVKASNAAEILAVENVSGVLVGGASLQAAEFNAIIAAAAAQF